MHAKAYYVEFSCPGTVSGKKVSYILAPAIKKLLQQPKTFPVLYTLKIWTVSNRKFQALKQMNHLGFTVGYDATNRALDDLRKLNLSRMNEWKGEVELFYTTPTLQQVVPLGR